MNHLIYVSDRHAVTDAWIAGRQVLKARELTTIDANRILSTARKWQAKLAEYKLQKNFK